jgi:hypothetical protein
LASERALLHQAEQGFAGFARLRRVDVDANLFESIEDYFKTLGVHPGERSR